MKVLSRLIARAARFRAEAVVVECMAIRKELIWASETYLIQATMAVITNARADHFEDLGEDPDAMADALREHRALVREAAEEWLKEQAKGSGGDRPDHLIARDLRVRVDDGQRERHQRVAHRPAAPILRA